jgi:hypothetical protein
MRFCKVDIYNIYVVITKTVERFGGIITWTPTWRREFEPPLMRLLKIFLPG